MTRELPTTIPAYLAHLRRALEGADAAMIHDALYDAEEYLRAELAANPGKSEAQVIADVAGSYGAPDEVADIYRDTELRVETALRTPRAAIATERVNPLLRRVFGVFVDPRTYGALFYMLLSLATGIFYFTWTVTGFSLSAGLAILIIGLPFFVLFVGASRVLALVEGRIVEGMLGERMPRRPAYSDHDQPWLTRIGAMFTDGRTWSTFVYFLLMLPLGIGYFTVAVTGLAVSLGMVLAPFAHLLGMDRYGTVEVLGHDIAQTPWGFMVCLPLGLALLVLTLHVARGIGRLHGMVAKHLLVRG